MTQPRTMWPNTLLDVIGMQYLPPWWRGKPITAIRLHTIKANLR